MRSESVYQHLPLAGLGNVEHLLDDVVGILILCHCEDCTAKEIEVCQVCMSSNKVVHCLNYTHTVARKCQIILLLTSGLEQQCFRDKRAYDVYRPVLSNLSSSQVDLASQTLVSSPY